MTTATEKKCSAHKGYEPTCPECIEAKRENEKGAAPKAAAPIGEAHPATEHE